MTARHEKNPEPADTPKTDASGASTPAIESDLRRGKPWFPRLAAMILAPAITLALLELILRLAGFGYPTGFLLTGTRSGKNYFIQNGHFGWRFFGPSLSRVPSPLFIPQPEAANTVRIFVFGESAAFGDPQRQFGLSRMLQAMLSLRYPGVRFEVENAAMTAINSHAVLPIARDCARAGSDLWVVYMGNNEVVGPFGAGTIFGPKAPPLPLIRVSLWLKSTRTGQLLDSLRQWIQKPSGKSTWTGMAMFLGQQVRADDPRMSQVYHYFERNLADILEAGRRSGAGIVLSTMAVNLKECPPLASTHRPGLSGPDQSKWEQLCQLGARAQDAGSNAAASGLLQEAAKLDDSFAELRFRQGQCALALGKIAEAQRHFVAARDLDTLRFRCDSRLNELIRQAAAGKEQDRIRLADAERAIGGESPDGLPGEDLFYDHVHFTFQGNYLLARTIAGQIETLLPPRVAGRGAGHPAWPSLDDCAERLAWSDWNRYDALHLMYPRLLQPPFSTQLGHEARRQRLQASLEKLAPAMAPAGLHRAIEICEKALAAAPDDPDLYTRLGFMKLSAGDGAGIQECAKRQIELVPSDPDAWGLLGLVCVNQHMLDDAAVAFRRQSELAPNDPQAMRNYAFVLALLGRTDDAIREYRRMLRIQPGYGPAWVNLGQVYEHTGRMEKAQDCYQKALVNNVDPAQAQLMAQFCRGRGWLEAAATNYDRAIDQDPVNPGLRIEAGINLLQMQRYAPAEDEFHEALRLNPESTQPHMGLGIALMRAGRRLEAATQFDEVLRLDPTNALALRFAEESREPLDAEKAR